MKLKLSDIKIEEVTKKSLTAARVGLYGTVIGAGLMLSGCTPDPKIADSVFCTDNDYRSIFDVGDLGAFRDVGSQRVKVDPTGSGDECGDTSDRP